MKTRESISVALRFHILRRDHYTCRYCGARAPDVALHVEHIKPVVKGGTNDPDNLCAACVRCNIGKGTSPAEADPAFDKVPAYYRDWWLSSSRYAWFGNEAYVGESPECRVLLQLFATHPDPWGSVEIDIDDVLRSSGLSRTVVLSLIRGLTAVGYLSQTSFLEDENGDLREIRLDLPPVDTGHERIEHIPRRPLASFGKRFASVEYIHG